MTPNGLQKLTNINNDNLYDKYLSIHADTFDTIITRIINYVKDNLKCIVQDLFFSFDMDENKIVNETLIK